MEIHSQSFTRLALTLLASVLVLSCGGGGGGGTSAGIDRGGIYSGPVTAYGSIWVNGSRYVTSEAQITVNGQTASEDDIRIGQVVVIQSKESSGFLNATHIDYESNLTGPVSSINLIDGSFVALGQTVVVSTSTTYSAGLSPAGFAALKVDDIVEVSGLVDSLGRILATRIELKGLRYDIRLTGIVRQTDGNSFTIGAQEVDFSSAAISGFPGGEINNQDQVRVVGSVFNASGAIVANEVTYRGGFASPEEGDEAEVEGLIVDYSGSPDFSVAGFAVRTNAQTEYSGGTAANLANNIRIEVEGDFNAAGLLVADKIEFRKEGDAELEATVDAIDTAANVVTVFGIDVELTSRTQLEDKRDETRPFSISNLVVNDFLKISGSWDGDRLIATSLERIDPEDKYKLDGPAQSAAGASFVVLGKTVRTLNGATEFEVNDVEGRSQTEFFTALDACLGSSGICKVEAGYKVEESLLTAKEVSLDD